MDIKSNFVGNKVILQLIGTFSGEPDLEVFSHTINKLIQGGKYNVILDMSEVPWINSLGLGHVMSAISHLRNKGGDLKMAGANPTIRRLLEMTSLTLILESYEDVQLALDSFKLT